MAKKLTSEKAREILHDKSVHGHPLTDKQRRFFGAIAGGAPVKAQKGKKVIIDGKEYDTSDPAYRNLYMFGDHPEGKGSIGYFDKEGRLITSKTTLPEVVIWPKDKETKKYYDKLSEDQRYAFEQLAKKYGPVNVREDWGEGVFSGTAGHYNPFTNTITVAPYTHFDGAFIGELAHKVQFDKQGKFDVIGDFIFNDLPNYMKGKSPYEDPNAIEYEAHRIIEPKLRNEAIDYVSDSQVGNNYNKFKTGGWLDKYQEGGVESRQAGYTDIPFNYNSAWGGQFAMGGSLPGSVGFTYARTQGAAPSNGPYAKKTKASAQNGMTYYQHGLDWKPKTISKNGSDIPKNQNAQYVLPRAASESTAVQFFDPVTKRMVSSATTGQKKSDVASSTIDMAMGKQMEKEEKQKRIAERKAAIATKDKGKPFTLPSGETKKYDQMDWREKAYVSGKALEQRGRMNENDETFLDEWLNPLTWIGDVASSIGTAPYEARESNSNLPYVGAVVNPLVQGALGFDPLGGAINTGRKVGSKIGQSIESGVLSNTYKLNPSTKIVYQETKPLTNTDFWTNSEISEMISKTKNKSALFDEMYDEIEKLNLPDVQTPNALMNLRPDYRKKLEQFGDINFKNKFLTPEQEKLLRENNLGWEIDMRSILNKQSLNDYVKGKQIKPLTGSEIDLLKFTGNKDIFTNPYFGRNYYEGIMPKGQSSYYIPGHGSINFEKGKLNRDGGVIKDDRGQWAHPGEITEIGSNRITMQGVPYPVLGISNTGDTQMMFPGEEYKFKGKKVTEIPMAQKGRKNPPVYVNDPNDPRLKLYNDSLSTFKRSQNPWFWEGTKVTTKQDYEKKLEAQRKFPHWSFDEDQYKKDKKKGKLKDFNDYMYDVTLADKPGSREADAHQRNVGKDFEDLETPIEKKLPDGRIKQYWQKYKGKLIDDSYSIYDPVTGSTSSYLGNSLLGLYNPNIKPIGHIYHAFDKPYDTGGFHVSSEDSEYVNKVLKNKSKKKKDYINYTYGASDSQIYKEPVQPVVYDKKKYNPNDPRLKQLQESFDKFHSTVEKKSKKSEPPKPKPAPPQLDNVGQVQFQNMTSGRQIPNQISVNERHVGAIPPPQKGQYRVSYYNPEMKDWDEAAFMSQQESDQFANEMSGRGFGGAYGNVTQTKKVNQKENGGWLNQYK